MPKLSWGKRKKAGGITLTVFRQYFKATVIETVTLAQKQTYRSIENQKSPEINPHIYGQLTYNKTGKNIQGGKDSLFSQ